LGIVVAICKIVRQIIVKERLKDDEVKEFDPIEDSAM
jgi:hypothetical protein